jgi:hypothetical protein
LVYIYGEGGFAIITLDLLHFTSNVKFIDVVLNGTGGQPPDNMKD